MPLPVQPLLKAQCTSPIKRHPAALSSSAACCTSRVASGKVRVTGEQGSGILKSMSDANCFIMLHDHVGNVEAGATVDVQILKVSFDGTPQVHRNLHGRIHGQCRLCSSPGACRGPRTAHQTRGPPVPLAGKRYGRAKLVDGDGRAVKAASLKTNHNYVFHYPFASTPCFLLKLDKSVTGKAELKVESGGTYASVDGAGAQRKNIVAFSAICAHKLAYPAGQVSFISYRADARVGSAATSRAKSLPAARTKAPMTQRKVPRG